KDPKRRFQTPAELLKALPTITGAIEGGRTITYQSLGQMRDGRSHSVTRKPQTRQGPEKISVARLPITGSDLFGRAEDIAFLNSKRRFVDSEAVRQSIHEQERTPTASLKNSTAPGRPCSKRYTILFTGRHTSYLQSAGSIQIGEYDYPLPLRNLGTLREVRRSLGAAERRFPDLVHSRQLLLHRSCAETRRRRPSHCHLRSEGIRASFERLREAPLHGDVLSEFNCSRTGAPRCP